MPRVKALFLACKGIMLNGQWLVKGEMLVDYHANATFKAFFWPVKALC